MASTNQTKCEEFKRWLSSLGQLLLIVTFIILPTILWAIFSGLSNTFDDFIQSYYKNGQLFLYASAIMSKAVLTRYDKTIKVNFGYVVVIILYLIIASSYAIVLVLNSLKVTTNAVFNLQLSWITLSISILFLAFSLLTKTQSPNVAENHIDEQEKIKRALNG